MKKTLFYVLISVLTAASLSAQINLQPAAIINLIRSEPITVGQLRAEVERHEASAGRPLTQAERLQVLDVMINERLVLQAAERDRITITENEVNSQIQELRNNLQQQLGRPPTDAEYAQAVRNETGLDVAAFREQIRKDMIIQKYLFTRKADLFNSIRVPTDAEIRETYELNRTQFVRPETVRFSLIHVPYGPDAASRTAARQLADRLFREIGSNAARFDEVVANSVAPNSGYQAGDFGYLPRNQEALEAVGSQLMNVAFSLPQGQVSQLIEGLQGFQIIKVTENHAMRNLGLDDIVQLGTRVTVSEYIAQVLYSQTQQNTINRASEEVISELRAGRTFQIFEANLNW